MGHEVVQPWGSFCEVAQLSCECLRLAHDECAALLVPGCVNDGPNVVDVGAWDGHCESVCVQDKTETCLNCSRDHFHPFFLGQRALSDGSVRISHHNKYCFD